MNFDFKSISERSLLNCHCKGVHSFVISENDGKLKRLYLTTKDHELWMTDLMLERSPKSIAFHPHRRDITLNVIEGLLFNAYIDVLPKGDRRGDPINAWEYVSKIDGSGSFKYSDRYYYDNSRINVIQPGEKEFMVARKIHTVWVRPGEVAAWLIQEGEADKFYQGLCYSNANLEDFVWKDLYVKPTVEQTEKMLTPYLNHLLD
jgi:hypothetical protein